MDLEIVGALRDVETIASGRAIREWRRLRKVYGRGRWRTLKGVATIRLPNGKIREAELHWYEAHGIGRKEFKIKKLGSPWSKGRAPREEECSSSPFTPLAMAEQM